MNKTIQEWHDAVGNAYSYDRGEGAVLMYCAGLEIPLEYETFINSLNASYAIREAILANNETSPTTCKLAASPVNWLFFTLIQNHIMFLGQQETIISEGGSSQELEDELNKEAEADDDKDSEFYLNAEQAKLIYHSVHDVTILYVLESLGISNGREPMFAEMLTLEIYQRSPSDPWYNKNMEITTNELYANYLFRWTRKGKALTPFPGCEEEYEYTQSSLCSLSVLMKAIKYGQNIKDWEGTCYNVTEEYFAKKSKKKTSKKKEKECTGQKVNIKEKDSIMPFLWTFAFGVSMGVAIMMFLSKYNSWFNEWKYESI